MATMATYPPLTPPYDLPVWLLPNNIFPDEMETTNLLDQYGFYDDPIPDFSAILTDIPIENGVERFNDHDLSAIEPSPFPTPPTPEPEPSSTLKPEAIETKIKQETSNDVVGFGIEGDEKLTHEENKLASAKEMPQQQHQQQQQKFQEKETKMEGDENDQLESHLKEDETLEKAEERPTRRCHSRYAFRPTLGSSAKPCRPTVRKQVVLWKFLEELLDTNENNCVCWVSREEGTFRFVDSKLAAKLWGQRKNKRNMTYEKLSRALRYYYDRQIMFHEEGQKLIYRFGDIVMKNRKPSVLEAS